MFEWQTRQCNEQTWARKKTWIRVSKGSYKTWQMCQMFPSFLKRNRTNWMDLVSCVSRSFDQYWIVWMVFFPMCGLLIHISLCQGTIFLKLWTKSDRRTVRVKINSSLFMNPRMLVLVDQTLDLQFPVAADGHSDRYTRHLTYTHR